jgi:hypothetical protein
MTVPGVGPITALCFKATIDGVGAYVGLTTRSTAGKDREDGGGEMARFFASSQSERLRLQH